MGLGHLRSVGCFFAPHPHGGMRIVAQAEAQALYQSAAIEAHSCCVLDADVVVLRLEASLLQTDQETPRLYLCLRQCPLEVQASGCSLLVYKWCISGAATTSGCSMLCVRSASALQIVHQHARLKGPRAGDMHDADCVPLRAG